MFDCIHAALKALVPFTVERQCFDPCISAHLFSNSVTLRLRDQTRLPITSFILGLNFSASHCGQVCHFLLPRTGVPPKRASLSAVSLEFPKTGVKPENATPTVAAAAVPIKRRRLISLLLLFMFVIFLIKYCYSGVLLLCKRLLLLIILQGVIIIVINDYIY